MASLTNGIVLFAAAAVLIAAVLYRAPCEIDLRYSQIGLKGGVRVFVRVFRWTVYRRSVGAFSPKPHKKAPQRGEAAKKIQAEWLRAFRQGIGEGGRILTSLLSVSHRLKVKQFSWVTDVGSGDAAETGLLCGAVWALVGNVSVLATRAARFASPPSVRVNPHFDRPVFSSSLTCIVGIPLGQAIYAGLRLFLLFKRGDAHARTSNSIPDANRHGEYQGDG